MFIEGLLCARDNARNWKDNGGRARYKCAGEFTLLRERIRTQIVHCNTVKTKQNKTKHLMKEFGPRWPRTWPHHLTKMEDIKLGFQKK